MPYHTIPYHITSHHITLTATSFSSQARVSLPMENTMAPSSSAQPKQPLRTSLSITLMQTLLDRATNLSKATPESPTWKTALQSQVLLEDGSWPYTIECQDKKRLVVDQAK